MHRLLDIKPKRVWVEGDLVLFEAADGTVTAMTAEVSIRISRLLGLAAGDALFNRIAAKEPRKPNQADGG